MFQYPGSNSYKGLKVKVLGLSPGNWKIFPNISVAGTTLRRGGPEEGGGFLSWPLHVLHIVHVYLSTPFVRWQNLPVPATLATLSSAPRPTLWLTTVIHRTDPEELLREATESLGRSAWGMAKSWQSHGFRSLTPGGPSDTLPWAQLEDRLVYELPQRFPQPLF